MWCCDYNIQVDLKELSWVCATVNIYLSKFLLNWSSEYIRSAVFKEWTLPFIFLSVKIKDM